MRRLWLVGVAVGSVLAAVTPARAEQARVVDRRAREAPPSELMAAGAPVRIIAPSPLTQFELTSALGQARPEVEACLQRNAGVRPGARVSVRLDRRHRLTIRVSLSPRDASMEACVDLAVRRHVQPLQSRPMDRPLQSTLRAGLVPPPRPPGPRPPPPPPPPTWPAGRYDESQVHGALDAMRASLLECVPSVGAGVIGRVRLRVVVHPDGSMTLVGVELPPGLPQSAAPLSCLAGRVGWLRIAAPPADRTVVHDLELGASLGR